MILFCANSIAKMFTGHKCKVGQKDYYQECKGMGGVMDLVSEK